MSHSPLTSERVPASIVLSSQDSHLLRLQLDNLPKRVLIHDSSTIRTSDARLAKLADDPLEETVEMEFALAAFDNDCIAAILVFVADRAHVLSLEPVQFSPRTI